MSSSCVEIFPINTGTLDMLESTCFVGGSTKKCRKIAVLAILIVHPKYGNTLFDLGLSKDFTDAKYGRFNTDFDLIFPYNPQVYCTVPDAIEKLFESNMISTTTINNIIISHSHWDHVGNINDFPDSTVFISKHFQQINIETCK